MCCVSNQLVDKIMEEYPVSEDVYKTKMSRLWYLWHYTVGALMGDLYLHYKGGVYRVLHYAEESTNARAGEQVVVYLSLKYGTVHTRDLSEWVERVEVNGDSVKRFAKITGHKLR